MTRGRGALVALTATSILLAGCTGDDEPEEPATPSTAASSPSGTSPTSEPSPSEPPPTLPPEAQTQDIYGAAAFIRFYFEVSNYALATGDVSVVQPFRAGDCSACEDIESGIEQTYGAGGSVDGALATIGDVVVTPGDFTRGAEALALLSTAPGRDLAPDGSVVSTTEATENKPLTVLLNWTATGWQMSEWGTRENG